MVRLVIAIAAALVAFAGYTSAAGYYVPRAYYTIDENGQPSPYYFIDQAALVNHHRVRRQAQFSSTSSSSSTSTSSGNGAPIFFNQFPGFGFNNHGFGFPQGGGAQGAQTFSGVSTSQSSGGGGGNGGSLDNRFGGDDVKVTGHTETLSSHNGQFTHTTSHLGDDGKIHFNVESGKF